jgi:hypothetical protein
MSILRTRLALALFSGVLAISVGGCSTPWAATSTSAKSEPPAMPTDWSGSDVEYYAPPSGEPDMTAVLDKLQQVRAIDPAAEQKLIEELRKTPQKSWPLVAEQFRASLAYHERLAARNPVQHKGGPSAELAHFETGYDSATSSAAETELAANEGRPSAPLGALVDPRKADADGVSSEAMAKSTPYSTPEVIAKSVDDGIRAPREFAASGQAIPISPTANSAATTPNVVQTRLESVVEPEKFTPTGDSGDDSDWQTLVKRAAEDLNGRAAASPSSTAEIHQHVSLRMLWLLAGDTEQALEPIPHITLGEQDYWSQQLFALATYLDHHSQPDDKRRAAAAVMRLSEAETSLRELASLTLRNLSFCKSVYGYGSIETFDADRFSPGEQVALYVEVENYSSKSTAKGFCTSLGSTYEILDESGERVGGGTFPDVDDCCQSRRRDFHIQFGLALPDKIEAGHYKLQLVVKDRQSDKIGHATASFEIRGSRFGNLPSTEQQ